MAQVVEDLGELAVGELELVRQGLLQRRHRAGDAGEHEGPGDHHGEGASGAETAEPVEEGSHGQFSLLAVPVLSGRMAPDSSKPEKSRSKAWRM